MLCINRAYGTKNTVHRRLIEFQAALLCGFSPSEQLTKQVFAVQRMPWVCAPIRAPGSRNGQIWDQAMCLFERSEFAH
jgi:hypothetical protein